MSSYYASARLHLQKLFITGTKSQESKVSAQDSKIEKLYITVITLDEENPHVFSVLLQLGLTC